MDIPLIRILVCCSILFLKTENSMGRLVVLRRGPFSVGLTFTLYICGDEEEDRTTFDFFSTIFVFTIFVFSLLFHTWCRSPHVWRSSRGCGQRNFHLSLSLSALLPSSSFSLLLPRFFLVEQHREREEGGRRRKSRATHTVRSIRTSGRRRRRLFTYVPTTTTYVPRSLVPMQVHSHFSSDGSTFYTEIWTSNSLEWWIWLILPF